MSKWYAVQTWDEEFKCVRYHDVPDAIDMDDAASIVRGLHPEQSLLSVVKKNDNSSDL